MKEEGTVTRREFLKGAAGLAVGMAFGVSPPVTQAGERSRVVIVRDAKVLGPGGEIETTILRTMLDDAVRRLLDEREALQAWQKLFKKSDVVGIKSNVWRYLPTPKEMEAVIHGRLRSVGIREADLAVDDWGIRKNPVFLRATSLVNVRPVRTHHWAGVGTCLKNYIMFVPVPSEYHDNACSELGRIWTLPPVKGKTRINILVALTPQFYGRGPNSFDRRYVWPYKGLIVGTDPVAVDAVGAELLRAKRMAFFGEERDMDVQPVHIAVADKKYRLGVSDLSRIEIIRLGLTEDALV